MSIYPLRVIAFRLNLPDRISNRILKTIIFIFSIFNCQTKFHQNRRWSFQTLF